MRWIKKVDALLELAAQLVVVVMAVSQNKFVEYIQFVLFERGAHFMFSRINLFPGRLHETIKKHQKPQAFRIFISSPVQTSSELFG
jgi:hypothetical protein